MKINGGKDKERWGWGKRRRGAGRKAAAAVYRRGFTLLELLIAMVVGLVVLGAVYAVFTLQNTQFSNQESQTEMQQNARIAIEMMTREISLAGYRDITVTMTDADCSGSGGALPNCSGATPWASGYCLGIMTAAADSIKFTLDITDSAGTNNTPNGTVCNANEIITYDLYTPGGGVQSLGRKSSESATRQQVVENIEALPFQYYNSAGTELSQPVADLGSIAKVKVTVRMKAAKEDPAYNDPTYGDHCRRYELTSFAIPRNLLINIAATTSTATTSGSTTTAASSSTTTTTAASSSTTSTTAASSSTTSTTAASSSTTSTTSITTTVSGSPITNVTQDPAGGTVAKNSSVEICADISGTYSSRKLKTNQSESLTMTLASGNTYCATIPKHNNKTVNYWIELTDSGGYVTNGSTYSYYQAN